MNKGVNELTNKLVGADGATHQCLSFCQESHPLRRGSKPISKIQRSISVQIYLQKSRTYPHLDKQANAQSSCTEVCSTED